MPLTGGHANKFGNRYEGRWTVRCLIHLLMEEAECIHLEPVGSEGEGVEFCLERNGRREYHQVKRQQSGKGNWSIADLNRVGVLGSFYQKLEHLDSVCFFISTQSSPLSELAERARTANNCDEFLQYFSQSKSAVKDLASLKSRWSNAENYQELFDKLARTHFIAEGETHLQNTNNALLRFLVTGDPNNTAAVLAQFALDNINKSITAHDLWTFLEDRGIRPQDYSKDKSVVTSVKKIVGSYLDSFIPIQVDGEPITLIREEISALQDWVSVSKSRFAFLAGEAGSGKSAVSHQFVSEMAQKGLPVLAFRLDRMEPVANTRDLGRQLGELPDSPAVVLANLAKEHDCLLVIDQLDAVSQISGRHPHFFERVSELLHEAATYQNMRVLLVTRTFDLENDSRFSDIRKRFGDTPIITVGRLGDDQLNEVLTKLHIQPSLLTKKQRELLSLPLHLYLFTEVVQRQEDNLGWVVSAGALYERFWEFKRQRIKDVCGRDNNWSQVVRTLCQGMSRKQSLSLLWPALTEIEDTALAMVSEHVLVRDGNRIAFFHEGFFDYAFARHFVTEGQVLHKFLIEEGQDLFRRGQVRQVLFYLRDNDRQDYLTQLSTLLNIDGIRFHIQKLVFQLLRMVQEPQKDEWNIISSFLAWPKNEYGQAALHAISGTPGWFDLLQEQGVLAEWLNSSNKECLEDIMWFLYSQVEHRPEPIIGLLQDKLKTSSEWNQRIFQFVRRLREVRKNRLLFEFYMEVWTLPEASHDADSYWSVLYSLEKTEPEWAVDALTHWLTHFMRSKTEHHGFSRG